MNSLYGVWLSGAVHALTVLLVTGLLLHTAPGCLPIGKEKYFPQIKTFKSSQ